MVSAHPNVRVFISHGGLASMTEAIYHGVPIISIPLFVDQWNNSKQMESVGNGITLDYKNISEASVLWALDTILSQPS